MTTTIPTASPAHFLSLVPRLLGFTPRRSLVLVPFAGRSSLGAMRVDLPPAGEADQTDRVASDVIGLVCRLEDADGFAAVAYTDAALREDGEAALPHAELAHALSHRADACGLRAVELLCVGGDGWGSYREPRETHPLDELAALAATEPTLPAPDPGDQSAGARLPRVRAGERADVARALEGVRAAAAILRGDGPAGTRGRVDPRAIAALDVLDDLPRFFERCLAADPRRLDPHTTATLTWCLSQPGMRDVALVDWTDGPAAGAVALEAQLRWQTGEPYPPEIGTRMWGEGPRPDPDRLRRALALARRVAALTSGSERAPVLGACAWLAWALGRSSHAGVYAERALRSGPRQGLAEIVLSFLAAGHLPEWAFRPRAQAGAVT